MRYEKVKVNGALGIVLCNDINIASKNYSKGHIVTAEDIDVFKLNGINYIYGVYFDEGDISFDIALKQIAAQLCGEGLGYFVDSDGICKIVASKDGVLNCDERRIDKFNSFNSYFILNAVYPYSIIKEGDIIAELNTPLTLISQDDVDNLIFRLSGNSQILNLISIEEKNATFIFPHHYHDDDENMLFTSVLMKVLDDFSPYGITLDKEIDSNYDEGEISDILFDIAKQNSDIVFILRPLKSSQSSDEISRGIEAFCDEIVNYSLPYVKASDLLIAQKGKLKIIVLPYNYDKADTYDINKVIKQAVFTEHLTSSIFSHKYSSILGLGEKLNKKHKNKLITSGNKSRSASKGRVAVVILAAGQGSRSGGGKLLSVNTKDEPLFIHAVKAAIASNARPVFVVIGHRAEEMEEYLSRYDINVLYNPSYSSGIRTSIDMGLKSVPSSCDGAILLPADMPNITGDDINKMISSFDKTQEKQICLFAHKGMRSNPILWSRSLYSKADIVPENSHTRITLAEHYDYIKTINIKDADKLKDINFVGELKEYCKS